MYNGGVYMITALYSIFLVLVTFSFSFRLAAIYSIPNTLGLFTVTLKFLEEI